MKLHGAAKTWVAGEELIAAKAGERDGYSGFFDGFGDHVGVDAVHGWLIHRLERVGQHAQKVIFGKQDFLVFCTKRFRDKLRMRSFRKLRLSKDYTKCLRVSDSRLGSSKQRWRWNRCHLTRTRPQERR